MRILFLHSGSRVPSSRFRVLPVARRLRRLGHKCTLAGSFPQKYDYFPWLGFRPSQLLKRLVRHWHLWRARIGRYDAVLIDRELFDDETVSMEARLRRLGAAMLLEVDDGVFLRFPNKFAKLAGMADHIIAGNRFLAEYTGQYNDGITIIPTCIELDDYPMVQKDAASDRPIVVGWIGTTSNIPYLAVVADALRRLAQGHEFELHVVAPSSEPLDALALEGVPVRFIPWQARREVSQIQAFDIGLMPLPDDEEWTKYKCGLKLLQYMAVGLPAVASPVGVNADIVQHGVNGYLAADASQWEEALGTLISDDALRADMGCQARRTVEQRYSVEVNLPLYLEAIEQAVERRG